MIFAPVRLSSIYSLPKWSSCQCRSWMSVAGIERSHRALLFSGQGSQYIGMGKELYERYPQSAKRVFDQVDEALNMPLRSLIFDGDQATLTLTENAQPAILTTSIAIIRVLQDEYGFDLTKACNYVLGHSLGEYTALVASESLSLVDAVRLVRLRGLSMTQAVQHLPSTGMMVLIARKGKLDDIRNEFEAIRSTLLHNEVVDIGNINSSTQIVISGTNTGLNKISEYLKSKRLVVKSMPLSVSSLMKEAGDTMANAFKSVTFRKPTVQVVSNVTARPYTSVSDIPLLLTRHITSTVQWQKSIDYCKTQDISEFIGFGPGNQLTNLLKKDYPGDNIRSLETIDDILNYVQQFK